MISWDTLIMDTDFHPIYAISEFGKADSIQRNSLNADKGIIIGDRVWIGCRCLLLKGVSIPDGTIVVASSVITKQYEEKNIVISDVGVIRRQVYWEA